MSFIVWQVADKLVYLSSLGWDKHHVLQWNEDDSFIYQEMEYYKADLLYSEWSKEMELISWQDGIFMFLYYAPDADQPLYIRNQHGITYIRKDFDYKAATYTLDGTEQTIEFSGLMTDAPPYQSENAQMLTTIDLPLCDAPSCYITLLVYQHADKYYITFDTLTETLEYANQYHTASEQLVQMLKEHGIIEAP